MTVLTRLIGSGGYAFDAFCSSYGLEGTLGEMSSKLARYARSQMLFFHIFSPS